MLRIDIDSSRPGMTLALPVRNPRRREQVLLRSGYALASSDITRLVKVGVGAIWIEYPGLEFLKKYIKQDVLTAQEPVIELVSSVFSSALGSESFSLSYKQCWGAIDVLVDTLIENPQAALFLSDVGDATYETLIRQGCDVTYLSLLMGLKLEGYLVRQRRHIDPARAKELINLGVGAILHDLGVTKLDADVRDRFNRTGDHRDPAWREHTSLGYEMVRGSVAPSAAIVVLNHHQRMDGTGYVGKGYPLLDGHRIHVFSRVVAVADQFVHLCSSPDARRRPSVWALSEMSHPSMSEMYDPNVLRALFTVAPPYPPGSIVRLSNGERAVCIEHVPRDPCRPVVQILRGSGELGLGSDAVLGPMIELEEVGPSLYIVECDGFDVSEMNFPPPPVMQDPFHHIACL